MGIPITDPAALAAIDFINDHYNALGSRAPEAGSREEQHAINVLAAYLRRQVPARQNHPNRGRHWRPIESAPLNVSGLVWSVELAAGAQDDEDPVARGTRFGFVRAHQDGTRVVTASGASGFTFTHWQPLPKPPTGEA